MIKVYLYFTIGSSDKDPSMLSEILEAEPTGIVLKSRPSPPARVNLWRIDTGEIINSLDIRDHWKCLEEMIGDKAKVIEKLTEEWVVKLDIVVETRSGEFPDIHIPGALLKFVSDSRTILDICEYDISSD
ncbi:DUF4279 domain-containing protein [Prosthecodimorpha staleyi]|uniref:DUF4279 domain-containing protein n=1 Tax=Prosthecodimorpha staleyi TaxID=2840188 RepID=A0A947GBC9_9HYPH|nr:DUF4279 domain-containing protein [Prosthecodimorpha staleyi]